MGVPAMFRWLSQKYPNIVSTVAEEQPRKVEGETIPVDRTRPNPNGEEFDNLYLDMNGIVHPCSHPEDKPAPKTEADMMLAIFEYTDRVVGMVRPRKLLYLAVDGVAPRAKMNQQRSRRFRSAKEAKEKDEERAEFLKMLNSQKASRGEDISSVEEVVEKTWDSNAITPGTPFMHLLAESLQYWCAYKFTTDPSWKDMKVIISDASVPGEGEHKIMNFIRSQRAMPTHDPNTRHVIYGLDADLIMLGLATHEPHFRVLREDVFFDSGKDKSCTRCGRKGHIATNCEFPNTDKLTKEEAEEEWSNTEHPPKPYIWLHVNILREYLAIEMEVPNQRFPYNLERCLDDWVFMCFFVGNDFLPHLPSLEIRDKGIDTLIGIWRELAPSMDDYVTKDGYPDMSRVQQILQALAKKEAEIFRQRKEVSDRQAARRAEREAGNKRARADEAGNTLPPFKKAKEDTSTYLNAGIPLFDPRDAQSAEVRSVSKDMLFQKGDANKSAANQLKAMMKKRDSSTDGPDTDANPSAAPASGPASENPVLGKRKSDALEADNATPGRNTPVVPEAPPQKKDAEMPEDTIKLWEPGYEERYYEQKFQVAPDDLEFRHKVARHYAEGLCWVLAYYMQGCPSWTWYFPYHYAPFAADFVGIADMDPHNMFTKGTPFHPYEQLMGVLPAASNHAIPEPFRILMSDPNSSIVDFYPEDFPIDLNGKKFAWQGVAVLPFIDETRLLEAMATKYPELSEDEKKRNEFGKETLMFSQTGDLFEDAGKQLSRKGAPKVQINHVKSRALHGEMEPHDSFIVDSQLIPPFETDGDADFDIVQDGSMRVYYDMPKVESKRAHRSVLLKGLVMPTKVLGPNDEAHVRRNRDRPPGDRRGFRGGRGGFNGNNRGDRGDRRGSSNSRGGSGYGNGYGRGGGQNGNRDGGYGNAFALPCYAPPPPFGPGSYSWPPPPLSGMPPLPPGWLPPPPPGWNGPAPNAYGGGPHDPMQRPAWMNASNGPPPRQAGDNSSLRDERYYRPAQDILGRNGGDAGRSSYGGAGRDVYTDRPQRGQRHGGRGNNAGYGGSGNGYNNHRRF